MKLDKLKIDFKKRHHNLDYFTEKEIFQYINMAYCIGMDVNK